MKLLEKIVNHRLNRLTKEDLMEYAKQHGIMITIHQAENISGLMRGKNINIFDSAERVRLIKQISTITSPAIAKKINILFQEFTGTN